MIDEQKPLRQLGRVEGLLIKLRRCPTCYKALALVHQDQIASWHSQSTGLMMPSGRGCFGGPASASADHNVKLRHQKIPHCPACQHTFIHGWIYPAK
jgi:hypothetical protein